MKLVFTSIFISFLYFFSGSKYFFSKHNATKNTTDSTMISIPFKLPITNIPSYYLEEKQKKVDSFYNKFIGSPYFSGSFIVAKNGKIISEKYQGVANSRTNRPIGASTPLHLASVSKVLTATAILKLVEENNINLDQKVTDWLPKFPYKETTIRTLLNHRSGLQHYSRFPELLKKNWDRKKVITNNDVLEILVKHKIKLKWANGTRFEYCNTNYVILALIIEKATGLNYCKAMKQLVFKPLKMNCSFAFNYSTDKDTVSLSYSANKQRAWDQFDALYGDKNIYSTPRDLVKFDLATYSSEFINQSILQEAYVGYSPNYKLNKDYGLGMRMKLYPNGEKVLYHNGWWHGNTSSFITSKKDTVSIICLSNRYTNRTYETMKLVELY
jgi:CubicO group peptidase (beta-lactamase class C family)